MLKKKVLFDSTHNEMLNIDDEEFKDFSNLLKSLDLKIIKNENGNITKEILEDINLIILGNPIDDFFSRERFHLQVNLRSHLDSA